MHADYFEAILQLRNPSKEVEERIVSYLGEDLSKVKKVRNGLDYYVKRKKRCVNLGKELKDTYGGDFDVSKKLFSRDRQTSKELYRTSVLVRLPAFAKKDVLKIDNDLILVTGLGRKVSGLNLKTRKKLVMKYPENFEILKKVETRVVKVKPSIEVLHPETYQSVALPNAKDLSIDQKVKVVIDDGVWFVS